MSKYVWSDEAYTEWLEEQAEKLKQRGFRNARPVTVTRLLHTQVILPNNIQLDKIIQPLMINKKRGKLKLK